MYSTNLTGSGYIDRFYAQKFWNHQQQVTLEDDGFKVDTFDDPFVVLDNFRKRFYDLLILDIKMPKMNGFELEN